LNNAVGSPVAPLSFAGRPGKPKRKLGKKGKQFCQQKERWGGGGGGGKLPFLPRGAGGNAWVKGVFAATGGDPGAPQKKKSPRGGGEWWIIKAWGVRSLLRSGGSEKGIIERRHSCPFESVKTQVKKSVRGEPFHSGTKNGW